MNPYKKGQIYESQYESQNAKVTVVEVLGDLVFRSVEIGGFLTTKIDTIHYSDFVKEGRTLVEPKVEPLKKLRMGQVFFLADPTDKYFYRIVHFTGESSEIAQLERGLCFGLACDAIAKAKQMLEAGKGDK